MSITSFTQGPLIIMDIVVKRAIIIYGGGWSLTTTDMVAMDRGVVTFDGEKGGVSNFGSAKRGGMLLSAVEFNFSRPLA